MEEIRSYFIGAHDDLTALKAIAESQFDIRAEFDRLATKSLGSPSPEILALIGTSIMVIGRCVNVFLRERKKRVVISNPQQGVVLFENFTDDQIKDILAAQTLIRIKDVTSPQDEV